ncbi:ATP-binding protein [Streptomyces hiroshimensis]
MCQRVAPPRKQELPFLAVPERVAHLRRWVSGPLALWGVPDLAGAVQLCVTELITDVITHVGAETPTWVTVSLDGPHLRIEVRDPDPRRFPAQGEDRPGRRLASRRGVTMHDHGKTSWYELTTGLPVGEGLPMDPRMADAEAVLTLYGRGSAPGAASLLGRVASEEAATNLIADLLHWFQAHGTDPDTALDRAQIRFEAGLPKAGWPHTVG